MTLFSRFTRIWARRKEHGEKTAAPLPPWAKGLVVMVAAAAITFGVVEVFFPTRIPPSLQGKWVVVDGAADLKGDTLDIFADGTMVARKLGAGTRPGSARTLLAEPSLDRAVEPKLIRGSIRVQDNTLRVTAIDPLTGNEAADSQTILDLTEDQLVLEDQRGELLIMKRQR